MYIEESKNVKKSGNLLEAFLNKQFLSLGLHVLNHFISAIHVCKNVSLSDRTMLRLTFSITIRLAILSSPNMGALLEKTL